MARPLADEIRPKSLDEVVGQKHLIGENGVLRRLIESGTSANMIFYGPPGTGKTYHTALYAVSIIEETDIELLKEDDTSEQ